jgi:hypothetical protein
MHVEPAALDNAAAESFYSVLKVEYIHRHTVATWAEARLKTATWIADFYNTKRRDRRQAIVRQRLISAFVSTSRARRSVVAWRALIRLVRIRQFFRSAKPCSFAARSRLTSRFASFWAAVSG